VPVRSNLESNFGYTFKLADFQTSPAKGVDFQIENMNKIAIYFKESYKELTEKVTWPNWDQLQQSTMIVLVATLVITAIVSLMDFAAGGALKFLYNQFFKG
jgi:preprotein translocase subunit SecE